VAQNVFGTMGNDDFFVNLQQKLTLRVVDVHLDSHQLRRASLLTASSLKESKSDGNFIVMLNHPGKAPGSRNPKTSRGSSSLCIEEEKKKGL
jgi:hypothetical protein